VDSVVLGPGVKLDAVASNSRAANSVWFTVGWRVWAVSQQGLSM
jgi:hypothetical protein